MVTKINSKTNPAQYLMRRFPRINAQITQVLIRNSKAPYSSTRPNYTNETTQEISQKEKIYKTGLRTFTRAVGYMMPSGSMKLSTLINRGNDFLKNGMFEEAIEIKNYLSKNDKILFLQEMGKTCIASGNLKGAEEIAMILSSEANQSLLANIGTAYLIQRNMIEASRIFNSMAENDYSKSLGSKIEAACFALKAAAKDFLKVGNFLDAEDIANSMSSGAHKTSLLEEIAKAYIQKNHLGKAEKIGASIEEVAVKSSLLEQIGKAYIQNEDLNEAERIATLISAIDIQSSLLEEVGKAYIQKQNLKEAERIATLISAIDIQSSLIEKIGKVYLQKGDAQNATRFAYKLNKEPFFKEVSKLYADNEQFDDADKIARAMSQSGEKISILDYVESARLNSDLADLAAKYLKTERFKLAEKIVLSLMTFDGSRKNRSLAEIGKAYLKRKKLDEAERVAKIIPARKDQSTLYREIGLAYIEKGDRGKAIQIANILYPEDKAALFAAISKTYIQEKNPEEAEKHAMNALGDPSQSSCFQEISEMYLKLGKIEDAKRAANAMQEGPAKSSMLGKIEAAFSQTAKKAENRKKELEKKIASLPHCSLKESKLLQKYLAIAFDREGGSSQGERDIAMSKIEEILKKYGVF